MLLPSLIVCVSSFKQGENPLSNNTHSCLTKLIAGEDGNFTCRVLEPVEALHWLCWCLSTKILQVFGSLTGRLESQLIRAGQSTAIHGAHTHCDFFPRATWSMCVCPTGSVSCAPCCLPASFHSISTASLHTTSYKVFLCQGWNWLRPQVDLGGSCELEFSHTTAVFLFDFLLKKRKKSW